MLKLIIMSKKLFEHIKEKSITWCKQEKLKLTEKESKKDHFLLFINYPEKSQLKTLIYAPKSKKDVLIIGSSLYINTDRFKKTYQKTTKTRIEEFKYDFYSHFLISPTRSYLKFDEKGFPERIDIIKKLWVGQDLEKKEFMEALDVVNRCREASRYFCLKYFHIHSQTVLKFNEEEVQEATREYIR